LGGNATEIGPITALALLAELLMFPLAGYIADHASRVKLIVLSNVITLLLVLVRGVAPSWELIAVASLLQGLGAIQ
jgi:MFS family permease